MKRRILLSAAFIICVSVYASPAGAAGTNFTDLAQDQASGLYMSDFSMGTAIFDFNNDGFDDIIVINYKSIPDRLYMSNGDGTFTEMAEAAGVATDIKTLVIATADIDASGYMDYLLFIEYTYEGGSDGPGLLYLNNGDQTFSDAGVPTFTSSHGYEGYSCAFADVDRDGLLDVFYGGRLYRNLGNLNFQEINNSCGLGNLSFVAHAAFGDIDNDNDPDLFIARQGGPASLYENNGLGSFSNITSNIEGDPYGLSGSFADIDSDGDLDLFISYSNCMYINDGSGNFSLNPDAGTASRYTRGSVFADFDNDGDPDLVLANEDGSSTYHENLGSGVFADVTAEVGMDNQQEKAGGVAVGDFDNDGDLDLYIAKTNYLINPCFNNNLNNNNSIVVTPRGTVSNFSGIGAKVYVYQNGHLGSLDHLVSMAELTSTSGFDAGTTGRIHLGTGSPGLFDVRVIFPSGSYVDAPDVASGSRLIIHESGEIPTYLYAIPGSASITQDVADGPRDVSFSLTDSKDESVDWTASTDDGWITIHNLSGTTPSTLLATVNPAGLSLGLNRGTIVIDAPDAFNSPVTLSINLTLTDYILVNVSSTVGLDDNDFSFGAAFFDYDLDGFDDIFLNNVNNQCRLYHSDGALFTDESVNAGVDAAYHNLGVFGGDLNADDFPDLLVFTEDKEVGFTYLNTGFGTFIDAEIDLFATTWGFDGYDANAADIDNDGDLDIFYGARLFRNEGSMNFTDITADAGLSNISFVCKTVFGDIDNDGDMDLIVHRQSRAPTLVFKNDGIGNFEDISTHSDLGYFPTALGTSLGDVDNDGDLDMYTGAGYSDPNKLFLNDGSGYFIDNTSSSGTGCTNYTRGTEFFDVDNDADLDLVVANENRSSQLFINDGTGYFTDVTDECGINDGLAKAAPAVVGDYDADGDLDVYIGRTDYIQNSFFKNKTDDSHFITVTPVGVVSNRAGIGAKCYLYSAGQLGDPEALLAFREYRISGGFNGSGPNYVHFGTGAGELFDLRVIFPSGIMVDQPSVTPGSRLTVIESGEIPDFLVLIPSGFNFEFLEGDPAEQAEMIIKNSAGNPIPWTAEVDAGWCQLSSYNGITDETIIVTVDPGGIEPGSHEATITVTGEDAINSPRTAIVRMTVTSDQPVLALSTESLYFEAEHNGFNPWPQEFTVLNVGEGSFDWTLQTTGEEWLLVYPQSGTAPSNVSVTCAVPGLDPGLYTATITVTAPEALNSPAELTVYFEVLPGDIPERDTVRVASTTAMPGDQITVPVYLHNITELAAFTIPLAFDPEVFTCDSISFAETRIEYINLLQSNIDTAAGQILFGMVVFTEDNLAPGDGEIARLHMTVNPEAGEQVAVIDTAFFPPAGEFMLFDPTSEAIQSEFVQGNIFISLSMFGDANGDGDVDIGDGVYLINYVFKGQRPPIPIDAGDANSDAYVNVGDIVYIINYVFRGGPPPESARPTAKREPVYYTLEKIAGKDGKLLRILIDSDVPLGGAQFEISDPAGFLTLTDPETGQQVSGMDIQYGYTGRAHRFGIFDMQGTGTIDAGNGELFHVEYEGCDVKSLQSLHVFDQYGNEIPAQYGVRQKPEALPEHYELAQNYPNPFNPSTTIKYSVVEPGHVELTVFNVLGQRVKGLVNTDQKAGHYLIIWDGTDNAGDRVATGIYFYRLKTGEFTDSRKMALIK
jgi:hypothetical protein